MARIAIVGSGIGGLTSALALSGQGHEITLFERRTHFAEAGAGIQLSRLATAPERIVVRRLTSGREIGSVSLGDAVAERFGAPYWSIARADLHTTLLDAVRGRPDVRLRIGRDLRDVVQDGERVRLAWETAGGERESIETDLAIGADGLWSRTRACLGDGRRPVPSGYTAYRATLPGDAAPANLRGRAGGLWLGRGRHVVHYPIRGGREINVVAVERRSNDGEGWSAPTDRSRVAAAFSGACAELADLLAAGETWSAWALADLPVRRMAAGRVALLGDAAHPALPFLAQGGAAAIEDAAVLAEELGLEGQPLPQRLARYADRRLARVARIQREARRNASAYHAGGPIALARDLVMGRLGPAGMIRRYDWLYGWRPDAP